MTDRERELHLALGYIDMCCKLALMNGDKPIYVYQEYLKEIMEVIENLYKKGEDDELNK